MCKLSSEIDLLKTTVSKRHSNYCGLKKNLVFTKQQRANRRIEICRTFWGFGRYWVPFWAELDPKGGPKIMFLGIMLEK